MRKGSEKSEVRKGERGYASESAQHSTHVFIFIDMSNEYTSLVSLHISPVFTYRTASTSFSV